VIQLFFGAGDRQLFGIYRTPSPSVAPRGAALLCPPWGQEYLVSHRFYVHLANRLRESGYHVLRFDYFGTGDSAGDRRDGDVDSWHQDAATALEELRDMSGMSQVAVFGIRLGACVAWRLASTRPDVHTAVLWDPIVSGAGYVKDLVETQQTIDRASLMEPLLRRSGPEVLQLLGFPMSKALRTSIERIRLDEFRKHSAAQVKLFFSLAGPDGPALQAALLAGGTATLLETLRGETPWREDEYTGPGSVSLPVLERMIEMIS